MPPVRVIFVFLVALLLANPLLVHGQIDQRSCNYKTGTISLGKSVIQYYTISSPNPGPSILLTGGIHGNEPAGYRAALQIRNWSIQKGTLVVIPKINRLGLIANSRWLPTHRNNKNLRDLNRNFPTTANDTPRTEIAIAVWKFVKNLKPDYLIDLHEGFDFHRINPKSVGSSVITHKSNKKIAETAVTVVNAEIEKEKHFSLLANKGPVTGSLAAACHLKLATKSFIIETTTKKQDLSLRVRQHRILVCSLLKEIGVLKRSDKKTIHTFTGEFNQGQTKIAVFDGPGAGAGAVVRAIENASPLRTKDSFFVATIGAKDVTKETLSQFDTVIFPGGSAGRQGKSLGIKKRQLVQKFVKTGGGYVGICAGAYLASSHYKWSFGFFNAACYNKMVDIPGKGRKSMWYRGGASDVQISFSDTVQRVGKIKKQESIRYQNGPILSKGKRPDLPDFQILAVFKTENGIYEAQKNTMIGAPAIVFSQFGKGKVLAISPHFESTKGKEVVLARLLSLVSSNNNPGNSPTKD